LVVLTARIVALIIVFLSRLQQDSDIVVSESICGAIIGPFDKNFWHFDITKDCVNTIDIKA
jgi:hypothetical protein